MNAAPVLPPPAPKVPLNSPTETLVDRDPLALDAATKKIEEEELEIPPVLSTFRRYVLLLIFCLAQFLDAFNNSALFPAIPTLVDSLGMSSSEQVWIISAFQLTFASFLLISGRLSDVYNPKNAFIIGVSLLGVLSIGLGFVRSAILLLVLRAFCGVAASLTIPSALTLLVNVFPEPGEQSRAIGVFGGCGAVGNVLGLIVGALIIEFTSWSWVFWFVALVALPVSMACIFIIPNVENTEYKDVSHGERFRSLDLVGITILTTALVLFIFAVTSGGTDGWATGLVLGPLVVAVAMVGAFLYWETLIPVSRAAVPPRTWFLPNFAVLFALALLPYFWWTTIFTVFTSLWQNVFHWTVLSTALHMIPIGVLAFAMSFTGSLSRIIHSKFIILFGLANMLIATILLTFSGEPENYWPFTFPAFVLGSGGCMLTFTHTNIAIFRTSPPSMAGTIGAIFNGALQLGSAVGIAAVSSITTSVQEQKDGPGEGQDISDADFAGRRAAFWFLLGIVVVEVVSVASLYRTRRRGGVDENGKEVKREWWRGDDGEVNVHLMEAGRGPVTGTGSGIAERRARKKARFVEEEEVDVSELEKGERVVQVEAVNRDEGKEEVEEREEGEDDVDKERIEEIEEVPSSSRRVSVIEEGEEVELGSHEVLELPYVSPVKAV